MNELARREAEAAPAEDWGLRVENITVTYRNGYTALRDAT